MAMLRRSKHLRSLAVLLPAILCCVLQPQTVLGAQPPPPSAASANDILGQLNNTLAQEASTRAALARGLALYAETVRMRVVRGALSQAAADSALRQRAREMAQRGMSIQDQRALRAEQQKEAALYFRYVERTVSGNAHWPPGYPAAAYLAEANRLMARARQSYRQAIAQNRDPDFSLAMAYWVLRLASGDADAVISATPFDSREGGSQAAPALSPSAQSNQPPAAARGGSALSALGVRWDEHEHFGVPGVWTRRGNGNVFDAAWGTAVRAVLTITITGRDVRVARRESSDGNDCDYTGRFGANGVTVSGTYRCAKYSGQWGWHAGIIGQARGSHALSAAAASPEAQVPPPASRRFENPMVQGMALDGCRIWSNECGQPAADAFCQSQGFASATDFTVQQHTPPTRVIGSGQICNEPFCGRIASLTCAGTANE